MASVTIKYSYEQVYTSVADKTITVQILAGSDSGGGGVTNHSELVLDDGTNPHGTTKGDVGLSNVDNTSDFNKPIIIKMNIGFIYARSDTEWHSGHKNSGFNYYAQSEKFGLTADTSPIKDIPSLMMFEERTKITRFLLSGFGYYGTSNFTLKLIKYNRNDLSNVVTIMDDFVFQIQNNIFDNYIDVTINNGLNDVEIEKGEVLTVLWKADVINKHIKDTLLTIIYKRI